MEELLRTESLSKNFGGIPAVFGVELAINSGTTHAVIGPNGAGKTTLFNLITKYINPSEGRILFKGKDITRRPVHSICRMGIARSFQLTNIYPQLTAFESVQMSLIALKMLEGKLFRAANKLLQEETKYILEMVGLKDQRNVTGNLLSHGDKKRLELAITLGSKPKLLLMDEPTAGMGPDETWGIVELIQRLTSEESLTVLFTEHDMNVVFDVAEVITVLHQGRIICEGSLEEVQNDEKVRECYLGGNFSAERKE